MPTLTIHSTYILLDLIAVFLLLIFATFLYYSAFSETATARLRRTLLACFFTALAISYSDGVLISLNYIFNIHYPYIVHIGMSFDFLVGPSLLFFIYSMTKSPFRLGMPHALQLLPFAMHLGFLHYTHASGFKHNHVIVLTCLSSLHLLTYLTLTLSELIGYRKRVLANHASVNKHSLHWLMLITFGLVVACFSRWLNNLVWLLSPEFARALFIDFKVVAVIGILIFACTVLFRSLGQPEFLDASKPEKGKSNLLDESTRKAILSTITEHMQHARPWLEAGFDLNTLATGIGLPAYRVSQVINSELQQNFFDFVNTYRVTETRRLLKNEGKSITEIMYAAGFNSKSVFNTAFKKYTGLTPSQYRKAPEAIQFQ